MTYDKRRRWSVCCLVAIMLGTAIGFAQFSWPAGTMHMRVRKPFPHTVILQSDFRKVGWPFMWCREVPTVVCQSGYYDFRMEGFAWDVSCWICTLGAACYITLRGSWRFSILGLLVVPTSLMVTLSITFSTQWHFTVLLPWFLEACVFSVVFCLFEIALRASGRKCWL